jgi:hypothetical protein
MPRYFLHLYEGNVLTEDVDGTEFPDLDCAIREAELGARDSIAAMMSGGESVDDQRVEIVDEWGHWSATVNFADVLRAIADETERQRLFPVSGRP